MKILHVLPSLEQSYGGPLRAVLDLSARSTHLDSQVVGFGQLDIPDNPLSVDKIHSLPLSFPKRYCYCPELDSWMSANVCSFDGVVLHGMWLYPNWIVSRHCRRANVPYACFPHGMLEPWSIYGQGRFKAIKKQAYWHIREKFVFANATATFFTTQREKVLANQTFLLHGRDHIVVPYGVNVSQPNGEEFQSCENTVPKGKYALFLGRVHPKKNLEFLIHAWAAAAPPAHWSLIIAGTGEAAYLKHLKELVHRYDLQTRVEFVGLATGVYKTLLFRKAQWFVLPSQQENFGISVLEALSCRCPVVVSDQVYLSDAFHSQSEVLPLQLDEWVRFFRDRMPDEKWRNVILTKDLEVLVPLFRFEVIVDAWEKTIKSVFEPKHVRAAIERHTELEVER